MKIKLYGHELELEMDDTLEKKTGAYGQLHINELRMSVDANLPKSVKVSTILHEVVEAINYFAELNLDHHVITALSTGLHETLARNPFLIRALMKTKEDTLGSKAEVKSIYDKKELAIDYKAFDNTITKIIEDGEWDA